jgi:hypothetical protein
VHPAPAQDLETHVHHRERAREEQAIGTEAIYDVLEEVLAVDARGLDGEVGAGRQRELDVGLAEPRNVDLAAVRRDEAHVLEAAGQLADLEPLREPRIAGGDDDRSPVAPRDLDDRIHLRVADPERLLPWMEEETAQTELRKCPLDLLDRLGAEVRIDPREAAEPFRALGDGSRDAVVRRSEVVAGRLHGHDDRAVDARAVHRGEQLRNRCSVPEQRLADVRERVDYYRTASKIRSAFSPRTSRSASASKPASLTFSTSIRGEQTGPSLA